jgi:Domain of unknown function (DUF5666)
LPFLAILFVGAWLPYKSLWHRSDASKKFEGWGSIMYRWFLCVLTGVAVGAWTANAIAQVPSENVVSPTPVSPTNDTAASTDASDSSANDQGIPVDPASLLPDLPALPPAKASLIGGTIEKLDRVQDEITVQVFGGGRMRIAFDPRTHIYLGTNAGSTSDLHSGDRVYVDTILNGSTVFAKAIRVKTTSFGGESQGIVTGYRSEGGELVMRDALSPRPLEVGLTPETKVVQGSHPVSAGELVPGTLVAIKFGPQQDGRDIAREISVLAIPGENFTFTGRVTGLDLRLGLITITSSTDNKTYEIYFNPSLLPPDENLRESADITAVTRYDGGRYVAGSVTVNSPNH